MEKGANMAFIYLMINSTQIAFFSCPVVRKKAIVLSLLHIPQHMIHKQKMLTVLLLLKIPSNSFFFTTLKIRIFVLEWYSLLNCIIRRADIGIGAISVMATRNEVKDG